MAGVRKQLYVGCELGQPRHKDLMMAQGIVNKDFEITLSVDLLSQNQQHRVETVVDTGLEAVIPVALRGSSGKDVQILAVIDTGFNGFLTLPLHLVAALGLTRLSRGRQSTASRRSSDNWKFVKGN